MKKLLTLILALAVLAIFSGLATSATTVKGSKSNSSQFREGLDKASHKLMKVKGLEVN